MAIDFNTYTSKQKQDLIADVTIGICYILVGATYAFFTFQGLKQSANRNKYNYIITMTISTLFLLRIGCMIFEIIVNHQ